MNGLFSMNTIITYRYRDSENTRDHGYSGNLFTAPSSRPATDARAPDELLVKSSRSATGGCQVLHPANQGMLATG